MTKAGRKPEHTRWTDLDPALRADVLQAIDDRIGWADIDRRFELSQKHGFPTSVLRRQITRRRKQVQAPRQSSATGPPDFERDMSLVWNQVMERVKSGVAKGSELVGYMKAVSDRQRLKIEQAADQRAEKKFQSWKIGFERDAAERLEKAKRKLHRAGVTDEAIKLIRDEVYGLGGGNGGK